MTRLSGCNRRGLRPRGTEALGTFQRAEAGSFLAKLDTEKLCSGVSERWVIHPSTHATCVRTATSGARVSAHLANQVQINDMLM